MKKLLYLLILIVLCSFASAALDRDLVTYYNFDQTSGELEDVVGDNDSTSSEIIDKNVAGIDGTAWDFDGVNDNVTLPSGLIDDFDNITINMWGNLDDANLNEYMFNTEEGSSAESTLFRFRGDNGNCRLRLRTDEADQGTDNVAAPSQGNWNMFTLTYNQTHSCGYMNGSLLACETTTGLIRSDGRTHIGSTFTGSSSFFDGTIDEMGIWHRALNLSEVSDLWNDGVGVFYPSFEGAVAGSPPKPTIVNPSPADNSHNNTNVTINVSHSTANNDVRYYLYLGASTPLGAGDLVLDNVTRTAKEYRKYNTSLADGTYYWKWQVQNISNGLFSANTTQRTLIIDTSTPTITIGKGNNFTTTNTTILSPFLHNFTFNVSFFDTYLYQTLINITNSTDESPYSILNTSITGTTANYTRTADISTWAIGNYTIKLQATDSHTALSIDNYGVYKGLNYLRYETEEGNIIKIKSNTLPLTFSTTKLKDRYDFKFNYLLSNPTYKYTIESYNKIEYLQGSNFKAHFVIMSENGKGNWIDFQNPDIPKKDYTVTKIDDYTYEVEITSGGKDNFVFSSLGGLNSIEEHYLLRLGSVLDIRIYDGETNLEINGTATIGVQAANAISNVSAARLVNITKEQTTITVNASGYGTEEIEFTITDIHHNVTLNMTPVLATKLSFFDEESEALITGESFSVYLERTGFSQTISSITDNPHTITGLAQGIYELKASSTNYPERQYFNLNVSNTTTTLLSIYLINNTNGEEKAFSVVDKGINPLEGVDVNFHRVINGTKTIVAEELTDYAGQFKLYLDPNYLYEINFTRSGYRDLVINLEPIDSSYSITMESITEEITNQSRGISYKFSPLDTVLNNNTNYTFSFTLNSSGWSLTNCTLKLKNGTRVLNESSNSTSSSCFISMRLNTGNLTNITSEATYELESTHSITVFKHYRVLYTYEGQFSLKNFIDDLSSFAGAGFNSFTRMIIALIVIFVIVALASQKLGFTNPESLIPLTWALVGFFSYVGWFYMDYSPIPDITGLRKYIVFILTSLIALAFFIDKYGR